MASATFRRRVVAAAGIGVAAVVAISLALQGATGTAHTVEGIVSHIDLSTRTAAIELIQKKTGLPIEVSSQVPPNCDIRIDGRPADLADLRVGQRVRVHARLHTDRTITVEWVRAESDRPTTTSAPVAGVP
jgi:hypothetical protein